jgi:hypothetical protein
MRNVHILPTEKPSRLWINNLLQGKLELSKEVLIGSNTAQHIYITSNEKIKVGDWFLNTLNGKLDKCDDLIYEKNVNHSNWCKKIILTTDQDLIKDGVQAIDDKFLEWFIANPSCEEAEVEKLKCTGQCWKFIESDYKKTCLSGCEQIEYKIIIPQEEPKQETLEEFIKSQPYYGYCTTEYKEGIEVGAKWQAERMYSEEDMRKAIQETITLMRYKATEFREHENTVIEQFKNK